MKTSALKSIIKEAVREAIQEELKEILLEAVKTPQVITQVPVNENKIQTPSNITQTPTMSSVDKKEAYKNILGEMNNGGAYNSQYAQSFKPDTSMDAANGTLPAGEVDMSQIMGLMDKK
tara:strand:- start:1622 stop:1978 length:357 start_codon:yes stop_codon:yes gene_type:complete